MFLLCAELVSGSEGLGEMLSSSDPEAAVARVGVFMCLDGPDQGGVVAPSTVDDLHIIPCGR